MKHFLVIMRVLLELISRMSMIELKDMLVNKLPGWPLLNVSSSKPAYNTSDEIDIVEALLDYRKYNINPLFSLSIGIKPHDSKQLILRVKFDFENCDISFTTLVICIVFLICH